MKHSLKVKIANTPSKLEYGLMFKSSLPDDEGMLFEFPHSNKLSFWGKNTLIPLDIAFVSSDGIIVKISEIKPFDDSIVSSDEKCKYAIEANKGFFKNYRINIGSKIKIEKDTQYIDVGTIYFIEGNIDNKQNNKNAQVLDNNMSKIEKPNTNPIGNPIGKELAEQKDIKDLPIFSTSDIGKFLEDSFDEENAVLDDTQKNDGNVFNNENEIVPQNTIDDQEQFQDVQEVQEKQYPQFSNVFDALEWAKNNNEVVRIDYVSKKGRKITRDIEPHGDFHSESTHHQILVTFDETVGNIRAFIIHNILTWAFAGRQFSKKFIVKS